MAEFMLQDRPEVSPRRCLFCDNFDCRWLTTFTTNDRGQTMLICEPCACLIANAVGGLSPEAASNVRLERDEARDEVEAIRLRLERLRDGVMEQVA